MTRAAHPPELVRRAHELKRQGMTYRAIAARLMDEFDRFVGSATVRDWVTYYTRGTGS
ncbi:MAG TPA: hypothetical protein VFZ38_17860 [Vicinamibacterales bacterium]